MSIGQYNNHPRSLDANRVSPVVARPNQLPGVGGHMRHRVSGPFRSDFESNFFNGPHQKRTDSRHHRLGGVVASKMFYSTIRTTTVLRVWVQKFIPLLVFLLSAFPPLMVARFFALSLSLSLLLLGAHIYSPSKLTAVMHGFKILAGNNGRLCFSILIRFSRLRWMLWRLSLSFFRARNLRKVEHRGKTVQSEIVWSQQARCLYCIDHVLAPSAAPPNTRKDTVQLWPELRWQ